jgi:hypothetical protein
VICEPFIWPAGGIVESVSKIKFFSELNEKTVRPLAWKSILNESKEICAESVYPTKTA